MNRDTELSLTISLRRKKPGRRMLEVRGEKRERGGPEANIEEQVWRDLYGLVEEVGRGGGSECVNRIGKKDVARLLKAEPEIGETLKVLEKGTHGLTDACVTELHQALARCAKRAGRDYPEDVLKASTHPL